MLSMAMPCGLAHRNPKSLWKKDESIESERAHVSRQEWKEAFEALYKARETGSALTPQLPTGFSTANTIQNESPSPTPGPPDPHCEQPCDFLNAEISCEGISAALKQLKRDKAAGVDGIKAVASWILQKCCWTHLRSP